MIILHDCDGNFGPLADPDGFVVRVENASKSEWQGETGQVGLEHRGPAGEDWIFFSLVGDGRYLVFSQRRSGEKIFAVDPESSDQLEHTFLLAGKEMTIADADLISSEQAASSASYFITQSGHLTPVIHWRKDGQPYWPEFD